MWYVDAVFCKHNASVLGPVHIEQQCHDCTGPLKIIQSFCCCLGLLNWSFIMYVQVSPSHYCICLLLCSFVISFPTLELLNCCCGDGDRSILRLTPHMVTSFFPLHSAPFPHLRYETGGLLRFSLPERRTKECSASTLPI